MTSLKVGDFELVDYQPDFDQGIAELTTCLWGEDVNDNLAYFRWKHCRNPNSKNPIAVVALRQDEVVGFRSYVPTRWRLFGEDKDLILLSPSDVTVHPDHRRHGLFSKMTRLSIARLEKAGYFAFLNLSSNQYSVPGYLKMGWIPLTRVSHLRQYQLTGLLHYFLVKNRQRDLSTAIEVGKYGHLEVSAKPRVAEMEEVSNGQKKVADVFIMIKDKDYLKWKFDNPKEKYFYYYSWAGEKLNGYVVLKATGNAYHAHIIDYAFIETEAIKEILGFIIKKRHFDLLTIWDLALTDEIKNSLTMLQFSSTNMLGKMKSLQSDFPVLIRPIKAEVLEKDWSYKGLDIRNHKNWSITEICSDGS